MAAPAPVPQHHALVIGNASYYRPQDRPLPPLAAADSDAAAVSDLLSSRGVKVTRLVNATNKELKDGFLRFVTTLEEDCVAIVYFAGHGWVANHTSQERKHCLLGTDATRPSKTEEISAETRRCLCLEDMTGIVSSHLPSGNLIMLVDTCRDSPATASEDPDVGSRAAFGSEFRLPSDESFGFLYAMGSSQERAVLVSPQRPRTSGLFTATLLKHLKEQGHSRDVRRLLESVQFEVRVATPTQVPQMSFLMHPAREVFSLPSAEAPALSARGSLKRARVGEGVQPTPAAAEASSDVTGDERRLAAGVATAKRMMQIVVIDLTGRKYSVGVLEDGEISDVKAELERQSGIPAHHQRLIFRGMQLDDSQLLRSHGIQTESILHLVERQRGMIGVFTTSADAVSVRGRSVCAGDAPGAQWLQQPKLPSPPPSPHAVLALIGAVGGARSLSPSLFVSVGEEEVVSAHARAALLGMLEDAWRGGETAGTHIGGRVMSECEASIAAGSVVEDFKVLLTREALAGVIGGEGMGAIESALGARPDALALRRTVGSGRFIGFHVDVSAAGTVQIPLSDESECEGGRLAFARGDGVLVHAVRKAGVLLAHEGDAVHGVTALVSGIRCSLFALVGRSHTDAPLVV